MKYDVTCNCINIFLGGYGGGSGDGGSISCPDVFQVGRCENLFLIILLFSYFSVDPLEKSICDVCKNNITMFCIPCKSFMCNTCNNTHKQRQPTHSTLPIDVDKENMVKVICKTHNTKCKYMCCNRHICTYCIHRDHTMHHYINLDDEIKNIKKRLNVEIEKYKLLNQSSTTTKENIQIAQDLFDQSITLRKQNCIRNYINLLNKEEKKLREQFSVTVTDYEKNLTMHNFENLKELSNKSDIEFGLLKDNIIESIERLSLGKVKSVDVTLCDPNFINNHPLGEIFVDRREAGADNPTFAYHDVELLKEAADQTDTLNELGKIYQHGKFNRNIVFTFVDLKKITFPFIPCLITLCQLDGFPFSSCRRLQAQFILHPQMEKQ